MRVLLKSSTICIDEQPLKAHMDTKAAAALVGPVVSRRQIPLHPSGIRTANISASGIVWYIDLPEDRISHLHLVLVPEDTPEHPTSSFTGTIHLNGIDLSAELSEASFPPRGDVAVSGDHHTWFYQTAMHHVAFVFKRRRNRLGRRSGPPRLSFVSLTFLNG